jgi:hypothetical protein
MRNIYFFTFSSLLICSLATAQQLPDKIIFDYDTAGNQIFRGIVIEMQSTSIQNIHELENATEDQQSFGYEDAKLRYYPNPVKTQLQVEWNKSFKPVSYMVLFTSNNQKLTEVHNLNQHDNTTIEFGHLPVGSYYLTVFYADGTKETVTIVKR